METELKNSTITRRHIHMPYEVDFERRPCAICARKLRYAPNQHTTDTDIQTTEFGQFWNLFMITEVMTLNTNKSHSSYRARTYDNQWNATSVLYRIIFIFPLFVSHVIFGLYSGIVIVALHCQQKRPSVGYYRLRANGIIPTHSLCHLTLKPFIHHS